MDKPKYLVAHCTGGSPKQTRKSIEDYWKSKGWKYPGYHYLIEPDGTEHILEVESKSTNGVKGHNHESIHVCYIGGIDAKGKFTDTRTPEQKARMAARFRALKAAYPNAKIVGHRDLSPDTNKNGKIEHWEYIKACPCFDAITEYQNL